MQLSVVLAVVQGVVLALCLALSGCTPIFSDLQDARVARKGNGEFTPFVTTTQIQGDNGRERVTDQIGFQVAEGLGGELEFRFRAEHFMDLASLDFGEATAFGIGLKKGLIPNRLALYVPLGFAVGSNIDVSRTLQTQPTLLATLPLARSVDFNPSFKGVIYIGDGETPSQAALNLGLGVHNSERSMTLRPEVGWLFDRDDAGGFIHFSLGLTFRRTIAE